jgi:hypothetical protein
LSKDGGIDRSLLRRPIERRVLPDRDVMPTLAPCHEQVGSLRLVEPDALYHHPTAHGAGRKRVSQWGQVQSTRLPGLRRSSLAVGKWGGGVAGRLAVIAERAGSLDSLGL